MTIFLLFYINLGIQKHLQHFFTITGLKIDWSFGAIIIITDAPNRKIHLQLFLLAWLVWSQGKPLQWYWGWYWLTLRFRLTLRLTFWLTFCLILRVMVKPTLIHLFGLMLPIELKNLLILGSHWDSYCDSQWNSHWDSQ